jgi:hypothetical protein
MFNSIRNVEYSDASRARIQGHANVCLIPNKQYTDGCINKETLVAYHGC